MSLPKIKRIIKHIRLFPQSPGVYLIRDRSGIPVYIGKAKDLRHRLQTHFQPSAAKREIKESFIQTSAHKVDIIQTASEAEALLLESSLVKQYRPRYNKDLKDDKSYPFLKITMSESYPRLLIVRGRKSDGSLYFGPYTSVRLLRQAVAILRRLFPLRTCNPMPNKVCLMYHIGQCGGPCIQEMSQKEYRSKVKEMVLFLEGKKHVLLKQVTKRMQAAAKEHDYELAKIYRDQMQALSAVSIFQAPLNRKSVLYDMQIAFGLERYPRRIEAFDISNFAGKNPVASMVVFMDGQPLKSDYRLFKIKHVKGIDDYKMMREVVRRRYERVLAQKQSLPDLVLIDGGKGHLSSVKREIDELNLQDLDIIALAKQHEYVFKPGKSSKILRLIRQVRDEAHRFAISFYRRLHRKDLKLSELDGIAGIGPKRRQALQSR